MQKTKPITSLCQTKVPLHFDSVCVVGVGLLLFVRGHLPGSAQSQTGHPYAVCFTARPVLAVSVYLINQNSFRIPLFSMGAPTLPPLLEPPAGGASSGVL